MTSRLTPQQYNFLLRGVDPKRVGRNPKGFAHMEAWDIRRTLTRVFGFGGWAEEILSLDLVSQIEIPAADETKRSRWSVVYRVTLRLTVRYADGEVMGVFENGACGDSTNQPSLGDCHDNALKTGLSQALKRCAINLGDQFGLSLYNDESRDPVINATFNPPGAAEDEADVPELPVTEVKPEPDADLQHSEFPATAEPPEPAGPPMATEDQRSEMAKLWADLGYDGEANEPQRLGIAAKVLGVPVLDLAALTEEQATALIAKQKQVRTDRNLEGARKR
ncbi:MAG TPA: hypothetical protein DGT23_31940 [Micromonosporaceae bacterium]|nr:hypothetical protein [Micromonosporaceae bacterium]